ERYCALSGYAQSELLGQRLRLFGQIDNVNLFYTDMLAVISKGKVWRGSLQARNKAGGIYWVSATVVPLNNEGRYSLVNSAFVKLFGLPSSVFIGHTAATVMTAHDYDFMFEKDESLRALGGVQTYETPYTDPKTGLVLDFLHTKALSTDHAGNITGIVGVIVDVTERNRSQRQ
ncbi:PAS domain S-box protein, partial [bacterium]|nr:PAS domain S-box protein [bacterium]